MTPFRELSPDRQPAHDAPPMAVRWRAVDLATDMPALRKELRFARIALALVTGCALFVIIYQDCRIAQLGGQLTIAQIHLQDWQAGTTKP